MSQNQKMLKIMSFIAVLAAFGMAWWTFMSLSFANTSPGLLLAICALVPCLLDAVIGVWGVPAANKPVRTLPVYYAALVWLALVLNIVAVVVYVLIGGMPWPSIVNLVVVALYLYFWRGVHAEALR